MSDETSQLLANPDIIACPSCDLLADTSALKMGESAKCTRCGHFLTEHNKDAIEKVMAYALTASILLILACSEPFLSFKAAGLENMMTLPSAVLELYHYGMPDLAFLVAAFIILIPTLILTLILLLCIPLYFNSPSPGLARIARLIFTLEDWSMVEVFLVGVIVSLVKIAAMATVILGFSFWAYFAFTLCFTLAMSNLDRLQFWIAIEKRAQTKAMTNIVKKAPSS